MRRGRRHLGALDLVAEVDAAGELADDEQVDALDVAEGRRAGERFDRADGAQVGEQAELLADAEQARLGARTAVVPLGPPRRPAGRRRRPCRRRGSTRAAGRRGVDRDAAEDVLLVGERPGATASRTGLRGGQDLGADAVPGSVTILWLMRRGSTTRARTASTRDGDHDRHRREPSRRRTAPRTRRTRTASPSSPDADPARSGWRSMASAVAVRDDQPDRRHHHEQGRQDGPQAEVGQAATSSSAPPSADWATPNENSRPGRGGRRAEANQPAATIPRALVAKAR